MKSKRRSPSESQPSKLRRRTAVAATLLFAAYALLVFIVAPKRVPHAIQSHSPLRVVQWSEAARQKIATRIAVLFRPSLLGAHRWSLVVMDERGRVLFADAPSRAVAPASAQKIIVAETALRVLGPSFRFPTLLVARSPVGASKHIATLWVVGSGDPSLRARDLRDSARALRRIGVRSIGRIAVDPTASRSAELNPHWNPRNDGAPYQAPTSAISVDGNLFDSTPVVHPNRVAGEILRKALQHVGIRVRSAVVISPAPLLGSVLWEHYSAPLTTLERHMLVQSDNHYAEQLLQAVALRSDERADNAAGFRAERAMLRTLHVPTPGLHLLDGSGLSHGNRIAAITLATLLLRTRGRGAYDMEPLLARAGLDGTLQGIDFGAASGRVRAKTGHLDDASSLEGFVRTRHHGEVIFAFEVNGSPGDPDAAMRRAVAALSLM